MVTNTILLNMDLVPKKVPQKEKLNCSICNYRATCKCNYQSHIATHTDPFDKTMFKCLFCDHREKILLSLRRHMFIHEDNSKELQCWMCNVFCKSEIDFDEHMRLHKCLNREYMIECMYCDYKAYTVNTMKIHLLTHKRSRAVQQCCLCPYKSKSKVDLLRHFLIHKESPALDVFKCNLCKYKTNRLNEMRLHLSTHYDEHEVFKCSLCDCECRDKHDLAKHFLYHKDSSNLDLLKCSFCSYKTVYLGDFRLHLLKHNRSLNNSKFCWCQYSCNFCEYKTTHQYKFKLHLYSHKDYSYCKSQTEVAQNEQPEQPFSQKGALADCSERDSSKFTFRNYRCDPLEKPNSNFEIIKAENPSKSQDYQCDVCPFRTGQIQIFKRHKEIHKDRLELYRATKASLKYKNPEERLMLYCKMCNYKTTYTSHFKKHVARHLRTVTPSKYHKGHVEGQPIDSTNCTSNYTSTASWKEHSSVHINSTEKLIHYCRPCGFITSKQSHFKQHMLQHPKDAT